MFGLCGCCIVGFIPLERPFYVPQIIQHPPHIWFLRSVTLHSRDGEMRVRERVWRREGLFHSNRLNKLPSLEGERVCVLTDLYTGFDLVFMFVVMKYDWTSHFQKDLENSCQLTWLSKTWQVYLELVVADGWCNVDICDMMQFNYSSFYYNCFTQYLLTLRVHYPLLLYFRT